MSALPALVFPQLLAAIEILRPTIAGTVVAGILITVATNVATWLIANRLTAARYEERQKQLTENNKQMQHLIDELKGAVGEVTFTVNKLYGEIRRLDKDRSDCELRATNTYATNDQFAQIVVQLVSNNNAVLERIENTGREIRTSIGNIHKRVDKIDREVVTLTAQGEKS